MCVGLIRPNLAGTHRSHPFPFQRVLLKEPSKPPSLVTNWSSSTCLHFQDMCRVLSCYHPSEALRHSRPLYQRLARNVRFRITIPYGYHLQQNIEKKSWRPPAPIGRGDACHHESIRLWVLLDRIDCAIRLQVRRGYRHRRHRRR